MKILKGMSIKKENWRDIIDVELKSDRNEGCTYTIEEDKINSVYVDNSDNTLRIIMDNLVVYVSGKNTITYHREYTKGVDYLKTGLEEIYKKEIPVVEEVKFDINTLPMKKCYSNDLVIDRVVVIESEDFVYSGFLSQDTMEVLIPIETGNSGVFKVAVTSYDAIREYIISDTSFVGLRSYELLKLGNRDIINLDKKELKFNRYECSLLSSTVNLVRKDIYEIRQVNDMYYFKANNDIWNIVIIKEQGFEFNFAKKVDEMPTEGAVHYKRKVFAKSDLSKKIREPFSFFEL